MAHHKNGKKEEIDFLFLFFVSKNKKHSNFNLNAFALFN